MARPFDLFHLWGSDTRKNVKKQFFIHQKNCYDRGRKLKGLYGLV